MLMRVRLGRSRGSSRLTCWSARGRMTKAAPPSETGQQSSSFSGDATGFDTITSATVIGSWKCCTGMGQRIS